MILFTDFKTVATIEVSIQTKEKVFPMYHIIINPASRSGKGLKIWKSQIEPALLRDNVPYRPYFSERAGDVARLAAEITAHASETPVLLIVNGFYQTDLVFKAIDCVLPLTVQNHTWSQKKR